jgi:phosphomannomutase
MLLLLRRLHEEKVPLSALRRRLQTYVHSGERNFAVSDPLAIMQRVREMYAPRASLVSDLDGIRIELRDPANPQEDWWFSLRASNTEPLLRLNLEARTREKMEGHLAELIRALEV